MLWARVLNIMPSTCPNHITAVVTPSPPPPPLPSYFVELGLDLSYTSQALHFWSTEVSVGIGTMSFVSSPWWDYQLAQLLWKTAWHCLPTQLVSFTANITLRKKASRVLEDVCAYGFHSSICTLEYCPAEETGWGNRRACHFRENAFLSLQLTA